MKNIRSIKKIIKAQPTMEGAGVKLKRVFGFGDTELFDPFLLLDHFGSDNPNDYMAGFPWHPHRGIETVTYMLEGSVKHGDSLGNSGTIRGGDVQWMTAGSGIIHQEMPERYNGTMAGFQLWVNLPSSSKIMNPRYREVKADEIPSVTMENGTVVKVISGSYQNTEGPVKEIIRNPVYFDIAIPANTEYYHPVDSAYTAAAYVFSGEGYFDESKKNIISQGNLAVLVHGDTVKITALNKPVRFILFGGEPLREAVAWRGPIVMNTEEELDAAFEEYYNGTFIKSNT